MFLFSTYQMTEAMEHLSKKFPADFKKSTFNQENISIKDQEVTQAMKDRVGEYCSDFDWKLLELAEQRIGRN